MRLLLIAAVLHTVPRNIFDDTGAMATFRTGLSAARFGGCLRKNPGCGRMSGYGKTGERSSSVIK
jgi:hypothetical protein